MQVSCYVDMAFKATYPPTKCFTFSLGLDAGCCSSFFPEHPGTLFADQATLLGLGSPVDLHVTHLWTGTQQTCMPGAYDPASQWELVLMSSCVCFHAGSLG